MNFKTVASVFAAVTALIAQSAMAQAPVEGKARADVKAETAAAKKKGELVPPGEGTGQPAAGTKSTKPRADVKAETAAAKKKGELVAPGENAAQQAAGAKSTKTRAEVKAETASAKKKGELVAPGEGTTPPLKK